jgi:hypothetical protein
MPFQSDPPPVGTRVRVRRIVERFPHALIEPGATGTVVTSDEHVYAVRLDRYEPGLKEWDNELHWYPNEGEGTDDPAGDLEVIAP